MHYSCLVIDMAARSSQDQNATAGGNSIWCSSWGALISEGARALANLMPDAFTNNQVLNTLATDPWRGDPNSKLVDLAQATAALLKKNSEQGNLKWDYTNVAIKVLEDVGTGSLDEFIPRMEPFHLYGGSDSTLSLHTGKQTRTWQQMWEESSQLWERHVRKAFFSVVDCGVIKQIHAGLEAVVRDHDSSRGNPEVFSEQLILISAMNEKTYEKDSTFRDVKQQLELYPIGTVVIFGPGDADHWWPHQIGSTYSIKWSKLADQYFNELVSGKHVYIRGNAPLAQLDTRKWISKANNTCYDHHFEDSPANIIKMVSLITNLSILNRMLAALYEVGIKRWLLPATPPHSTHEPRWIFKHHGENVKEATRNPEFFNWDDLDESERTVCKKFAALANIQLPRVGEKFMAKTDLPLFLDDLFRASVSVLPKGTKTGPITGHGYYEDVSGDAWDPPSGLWVEYEEDIGGATQTVFMKITRNQEHLAEICHTAGTKSQAAPVLEPTGPIYSKTVAMCMNNVKGATRTGLVRAALLSFNQIKKLRLPLTIRRQIISG